MIINYKALLTKEDLTKLFDWENLKPQTQRNYSSDVMKAVWKKYKAETGNDWESTLEAQTVARKVIPTETFLKCFPSFAKSFRR